MANDPGWGNRNNNGGPPDLDEVLRQFSRKLNSLFGGAGKGDKQPERGGGTAHPGQSRPKRDALSVTSAPAHAFLKRASMSDAS